VQRRLSTHHELADVMDIDRHEAMALVEQVFEEGINSQVNSSCNITVG
jgi:hypothetical protein